MKIYFFDNKIEKFIANLDVVTSARVVKVIELLEKYGNDLKTPHSKSLGDGLFELRVLGSKHIRVIYTYWRRGVCVLHAFEKKTNKISKRDFDYAKKIKNNLQ
ncbi:MAG: type II toxin-antitoxin system RelE/ParE family toxin [Candidatus Pacebacteria bacterium]|nr:type II toxin-antitoxin system RelE/ParE family toxin [Candidatus Paceibacterota bacterium]